MSNAVAALLDGIAIGVVVGGVLGWKSGREWVPALCREVRKRWVGFVAGVVKQALASVPEVREQVVGGSGAGS